MSDLDDQTIAQIRELIPINGLLPQHQFELAESGDLLEFKKRQYVFKQGDSDAYQFYLLSGELELDSNGQLVKTLVGGTEAARHPMAQLQPRQLSAKAKTAIKILRVERDELDRLLNLGSRQWEVGLGPGGGGVQVEEVEEDDEGVD